MARVHPCRLLGAVSERSAKMGQSLMMLGVCLTATGCGTEADCVGCDETLFESRPLGPGQEERSHETDAAAGQTQATAQNGPLTGRLRQVYPDTGDEPSPSSADSPAEQNDDLGYRLRTIVRTAEGQIKSETIYEYDHIGFQTRLTIMTRDPLGSAPLTLTSDTMTTNEYADGNLVRTTTTTADDTIITRYRYDEDNRLFCSETMDLTGVVSSCRAHDGYLDRPQGCVYEPGEIVTTYDFEGNILSSISIDPQGQGQIRMVNDDGFFG